MDRISLAVKALQELGPRQVGSYALYRLQLSSGYLRWATYRSLHQTWKKHALEEKSPLGPLAPILELPDSESLALILGEDGCTRLVREADEIVDGRVRLFGGDPVPLQLGPPSPLLVWDEYESRRSVRKTLVGADRDIKFYWEPARFGWAFTLGRAYLLTSDERYPGTFWTYWEQFLEGNPPYWGVNWVSAQEAAMRILAFIFAAQAFAGSPHTTPLRAALISEFTAAHAARIPPSMRYGRAQNNNHLLSEAAGLFTAGSVLANYPHAARWRELGWTWFNRGVQSQIDADGAYVQHSTNYHRLMLQLALWMNSLAKRQGRSFPAETNQKLSAACRWLVEITDFESGGVPNLGPNDSAYLLPLTVCSISDFRPALQAACRVFIGAQPFPPGSWDEMSLWFAGRERLERSFTSRREHSEGVISSSSSPGVLRAPHSWGYLRAAQFTSRPGHADQLHLDLWWRGLNVALDAGSYLYNAPPPWDNSLSSTKVHNTLTVDQKDQMERAGRFLWLDWAQAQVFSRERAKDDSWMTLTAEHQGYQRSGVVHRRSVTAHQDDRWLVVDSLFPSPVQRAKVSSSYSFRLHWLLPDWPWKLEEGERLARLELQSPLGVVMLEIRLPDPAKATDWQGVQLVRAGELLHGSGSVDPILGWHAPTYGSKLPALSFSVQVDRGVPLQLDSEWRFAPEG